MAASSKGALTWISHEFVTPGGEVMARDDQDEVMRFLADPATHGGAPVTRIDTHAASVFLAGNRALKVKRAVRFPVLDYSTLAKRKAACAAELEVNHPYAPALYRGTVPITRAADGTLAIGGHGEAVEWAVEMARFDETRTLDHLATRGEIDAALADALGRAVARAHAAASVVADVHFFDELVEIAAQNEAELAASPELFETAEVHRLGKATRAALQRLHPLFLAREQAGLVRRCHGDLHLGNIVLLGGAPVLFDAIEFDPKIATGDVFYDLAFLLMDLIGRGLRPAANIVLNRYLIETRRADDLDALAALPLYLSLRATIRAKVAAERKERDAQSARDYFRLAQRLLTPPAPKLIAIGGLSGTGKSLMAHDLAANILPEPGAVWLRSDVERKIIAGVAETERLPASAYTRETMTRVYKSLYAKAARVIAAGHSAMVDAVFADPAERAAIAKAAGSADFRGLFLTAPLATRIARVGGRKGDASDAGADVARMQETFDLGAMTWAEIDASGTPEQTLAHAKVALK
jgi:aminoglycoside phosphotransferase family enzyme/predicted kinase